MKQLRCALYPRVSTEEQFLHGLSLPAQVKDLTDYANRMGYKIVDIYADEGVSARKPVSKRPALLRLLRDVEQDKIDLILVTKLDRWFRNIKEYQVTQEILDRHHCYWKTIFEDYDTSTANGQMVVNIMLAVAQNECDRTSERIKVVFDHKIRNGEHVTGAAPYGYILVDKKLQKDPETQQIVEDAFQFYFSCFSKRKTVFYILDKYQDHPKKPTQYQVNRILSMDLYAGIYQDFDDYYPAYVTKEEMKMIQNMTDTKVYHNTTEPYIFSGLIICPGCHTKLTGYVKKHKCKDGSITKHKYYRCSKKFSRHSAPCISETRIEKYMMERLCQELGTVICRIESSASKKRTGKAPSIRAEMDRLNTMYQKGRISDEYYEAQYTALETELASDQGPSDWDKLEKYSALKKELSGNWIDLYNELDAAHKNAFWRRIVKEVYIDDTTHEISGFSFN